MTGWSLELFFLFPVPGGGLEPEERPEYLEGKQAGMAFNLRGGL